MKHFHGFRKNFNQELQRFSGDESIRQFESVHPDRPAASPRVMVGGIVLIAIAAVIAGLIVLFK